MEPRPLVLDISSDEEGEGPKSIDYDWNWIKEFLGMSDEEPEPEPHDDDEVVVLREVKPERNSKLSSKDVDDDCMVLDVDPEMVVTSVNQAPTGSEELLLVGEKGQIACRDYPHPRHLCANFPFSSTPHERHCDQCHCYVCDSLAPCLKWGTGLSITDHCHATDKAEMWKIQRKNFKLSKVAPIPASTTYGNSCDVGNAQRNHILPLHGMRFSPTSMLLNQTSSSTATRTCSTLNPIPQNQASRPITMPRNQDSRPNTIPVCSMATNTTIQHGANHGRFPESGSSLARNRYQSHSVARQLQGVRNHVTQRERGRGAGSLGPQFLRSHMMSKEIGSVRSTLTVNQSPCGSSGFSNHVNPAQLYDRHHTATGFSNNRAHYGQNDVLVSKNLLYTQPSFEPASLSFVSECTTAYETNTYCQLLSQSNDSHNIYGSCIQGNDTPLRHLNSNQHGNVHQIGCQNKNATGISSQDTCQQKPDNERQSDCARKANFSCLDSSWAENTGQSIFHLQNSGSINQQPNVKGPATQFTGSANLGSLDDIKNWLLDGEDIAPVVADSALASELNIPSPDFSPFDTGVLLFDFENYCNGLAHT